MNAASQFISVLAHQSVWLWQVQCNTNRAKCFSEPEETQEQAACFPEHSPFRWVWAVFPGPGASESEVGSWPLHSTCLGSTELVGLGSVPAVLDVHQVMLLWA